MVVADEDEGHEVAVGLARLGEAPAGVVDIGLGKVAGGDLPVRLGQAVLGAAEQREIGAQVHAAYLPCRDVTRCTGAEVVSVGAGAAPSPGRTRCKERP